MVVELEVEVEGLDDSLVHFLVFLSQARDCQSEESRDYSGTVVGSQVGVDVCYGEASEESSETKGV